MKANYANPDRALLKISVIMATHNSSETVGRSIGSFLSQDYPEKELIVIDGASRDSTCAVVDGFASPLIRLHSENDHGIYDAINKGIRLANGDIICLLHSNDFYSEQSILKTAANLMREDELDAVYADVEFFRRGAPEKTVRHYRSGRFSPGMLKYGIMPAHPTLFLRRRVFEQFGDYRTDMRIAADFEFVARIFKDGALRTSYVPRTWMRMQAGGASTSGLRSKLLLNSEIIKACRINGIETNWLKILSKYRWKIFELLPKT